MKFCLNIGKPLPKLKYCSKIDSGKVPWGKDEKEPLKREWKVELETVYQNTVEALI